MKFVLTNFVELVVTWIMIVGMVKLAKMKNVSVAKDLSAHLKVIFNVTFFHFDKN